MSTITASRPQATEDRLHSDLVKLWTALGRGPWIVDPLLPGNALHQEILGVRYSDAPIKDYGAAESWVRYLVTRGFLTTRKHEGNPRLTVYTKAATVPEPDTRSYVEREQAVLDRAREREEAVLAEQAAFRRSLAEQHAALDPRMGEIASALRRLGVLDRQGVAQVVDAAVASAVEPLARQIAELSAQLAAATSELAAPRSQTTEPRRFGRRN